MQLWSSHRQIVDLLTPLLKPASTAAESNTLSGIPSRVHRAIVSVLREKSAPTRSGMVRRFDFGFGLGFVGFLAVVGGVGFFGFGFFGGRWTVVGGRTRLGPPSIA